MKLKKEGEIRNRKDTIILLFALIWMISFIFASQFFHYILFPYHENSQRITDSRYLTGLQTGENFVINYYPDYLDAGDNVILYVNYCGSTGIDKCIPCSNCILEGYFESEEGNKLVLFKNESLSEKENIEFAFPGRDIKIVMHYGNESKDYVFYVPKPSLLQSFKLGISDHIWFGTASVILIIITIIGAIAGTIRTIYNRRKIADVIKERIKSIKEKDLEGKNGQE